MGDLQQGFTNHSKSNIIGERQRLLLVFLQRSYNSSLFVLGYSDDKSG